MNYFFFNFIIGTDDAIKIITSIEHNSVSVILHLHQDIPSVFNGWPIKNGLLTCL